LSLRSWIQDYGWVGAIYLLAAAMAGVLAMNARQFGMAVFVVAAAVTAAVVALVRLSIERHEVEFQAQEARVAEAEHEARMNQQRFTAAFTHAAIGMALVGHDGKVHRVNQALCELLSQGADALLQRTFDDLLHPGDAVLFKRRAAAVCSGTADAFSMELRCRDKSGQGIWVSLHCGRFIDPATERSGLIYQLHDITSRRLAEDRLHHIAFHDSLTDLANRNCFNERLNAAVERNSTDAAQGFAVMFMDLDRFKLVNDSLGHQAGNALLCEVARRLSGAVRPGDLVARLGGDELATGHCHGTGPEAAAGAGGADRDQRHRGDAGGQHRHHLQRPGLPHGRRSAARCRPGHVRGQGRRQPQRGAVQPGHARTGGREAQARR
jgi:PAS domain S-box-containing protein